MKNKIYAFVAMLYIASTTIVYSQNGFAIVIDPKSYKEAKTEVDKYASAVEADGLKPFIVIDKWNQPDSIKNELKRLYHQKKNPIEGAVFIGDIPIPMLRDAQHLTSAFKMQQGRDWQESSVPSDRFYDDFGLKFDFLQQDSLKSNYFYYSLRPDSKQYLNSDIYTARIRPLGKGKSDKYEQIRSYLNKVVAAKQNEKNNVIDNLTVARGHGYNSESKVSWAGEQLALYEQLPQLYGSNGFIKFMDFESYWPIKPYWLNEVLRPDLDIMLFHHHGANDTQYANGYKTGSDVGTSIENIKLFLRSKISSAVRRGKTKEEAIEYYAGEYDLPRSWCEEAFNSDLLKQDSIYEKSLDISFDDILNITPNARFVMFDACYNGSFYEDEYIAGAYIFNDGKTIVTQGNTVNTIQDKWPDKYLGLLNYGLRVGQWGKHTQFLETHIIGDPTFRFAKNISDDLDINQALTTHHNDIEFWKKQLSNSNPDVQAIALQELFNNNLPEISDLLKDTYLTSPSMIVRLQCLQLLGILNNDDLIEILPYASKDGYELIRRFALEYAMKNGSPQLLPSIAKSALNDNTSKRVMFKINNGLRMIDLNAFEKELIEQTQNTPLYADSMYENLLTNVRNTEVSKRRDFDGIVDKTVNPKVQMLDIRRFRNQPVSDEAEILITVLSDTEYDAEARLTCAEALGWFNYSYRKPFIIETLETLVGNEKDPKIAAEMQKSIKRLSPR